jgi:hypothetical protein
MHDLNFTPTGRRAEQCEKEHRCCVNMVIACDQGRAPIRAGPPSAAAEQGRGSQPGQSPGSSGCERGCQTSFPTEPYQSESHAETQAAVTREAQSGCNRGRQVFLLGMVSCLQVAAAILQQDAKAPPLQGARGARMPGDSGEPASADAGWTGPQPSTSGGACAKVGPVARRQTSVSSQESLLSHGGSAINILCSIKVRWSWQREGQRRMSAPKLKVTVAPSVCSGSVNSEAAG